jgi:hypothetical protein
MAAASSVYMNNTQTILDSVGEVDETEASVNMKLRLGQVEATLALAAATIEQTKAIESIGKDLADIRRMNARRSR